MGDATFPSSIGRYEILGRLASGGMAEVLLGRLRGPHGFERAVVVKRILPHLAIDRTIVDMFLDEARIIANLHHPNLIHVHELGHEDDQFFMVMEFLEGESVAGLCRRLASREDYLDWSVAAHIVAEACAGLHAAHEAKAADGRPLVIVHRDVSPQNIFVTYTGGVHVIDFGIATAVDRISRTETGTVRGKFEYLAPEQLRSQPLDRRADVFSLGVVLLELASGRRVFKRGNQAAALMAILNEPAPRLQDLRLGAPPELAAICARALSKERSDRYQTAAEMRRALLAFVRKQNDEDMSEALAKRMHAAFPDRAFEKADLLQRVREGACVEAMPSAEVDIDVEIPVVEQPTAALLSQSLSTTATSDVRRHHRRIWALVAVAGLITAGLGTFSWRARSAHPPVTAAPPVIAETAPSPPLEVSSTSPPPPPFSDASTGAARAASVGSAAMPAGGNGRPPGRTRLAPARPTSSSSPRPSPTLW